MSPRARWALVGALGAGAVGVASFDTDPPPVGNPLVTEASQILRDVHAAPKAVARISVEEGLPRAAQATLIGWIATLPLDKAVQVRLVDRIEADAFVDDVVPFALFVKEVYGLGGETFADYAGRELRPKDGVPGYEHSLFRFDPPPAESGGSGAGYSADLAARLLALYDAAYPSGESILDQCASADTAQRDQRAKGAAPALRGLLAQFQGSLEGDMADALGHVLADEDVLDTISYTLVEFLDSEVCRHYRLYALKQQRTEEREAWMRTELGEPGGGRLWAYLAAQNQRRHAVHVVVDGLQGRLVRALAAGTPGEPYLVHLAAEDAGMARPSVATTPAPAMTTTFLRHVAAKGYPGLLPYLSAALGPGFARHGISTTPTISVRNLPIAKTGADVAGEGGTGIPNFHWLDRDIDRAWYFYGNDALRLTELSLPMKTPFERLGHLNTMSCGAQYDEQAGWSYDAFLGLAVGEPVRDFGERLCLVELERRVEAEAKARKLRDALLERRLSLGQVHQPWEVWDRWREAAEREEAERLVAELAPLEGLPDYLLHYSPWPDHFAHGKGPFSDEIVGPTGELVRLDWWLGRFAAIFPDERTVLGMAGDHGLAPVWWLVQPEEVLFAALEREGRGLVLKKISSDEGEGPKLTHPLRPPSSRGVDAVIASTAGGNYMIDLFVDQGAAWTRQPVAAEVRALRTLAGATVDMIEEPVRRLGETLDYLVVRESPCGPEGGTIQVHAMRGGVRATGRIERRGERVRYQWEGADLLDLAVPAPGALAGEGPDAAGVARCMAATEDEATWCTTDEWRAATAGTTRPDSVAQLAHLYDTDRAGTVNLFPRPGIAYNSKVPGRHAGEHFAEKDALVALWGLPVQGAQVGAAVNGEVAPALYRWLGGEDLTGFGWPDGALGRLIPPASSPP